MGGDQNMEAQPNRGAEDAKVTVTATAAPTKNASKINAANPTTKNLATNSYNQFHMRSLLRIFEPAPKTAGNTCRMPHMQKSNRMLFLHKINSPLLFYTFS
jgi:hypothetical protein